MVGRCFPQGLKPSSYRAVYGTTEVVPFQCINDHLMTDTTSLQLNARSTSEEIRRQQAAEKLRISGEIGGSIPPGLKALADSARFMWGLKPPPPSVLSLFATSKVVPFKTTDFSAARQARYNGR